MNITQMISDVRSRTGDIAVERFTDDEILGALNSAQQELATRLVNTQRAYFTFQVIRSTTATEFQPLPDDFLDIVQVEYDSAGATAYKQAKQISMRDRGALDTNLNYAASATNPYFYIMGGVASASGVLTTTGQQIGLKPTPGVGTSNLRITYIRRPRDLNRFKALAFTTTGGSTTTVESTSGFSTNYSDDFWNGCEVTLVKRAAVTEAELEGQKRIVTDFASASSRLTIGTNDAFTKAVVTGMLARVDDVSILPLHLHPLMVIYGEARARMKIGDSQGAVALRAEYNENLAAILNSYSSNVDVGLVGDSMRQPKAQVS